MNKPVKNIFICLGALVVSGLAYATFLNAVVKTPSPQKDLNVDFKTSPVKLSDVLYKEDIGQALNFKDLTKTGAVNYSKDLQHMPDGKWNYYRDSKNTLVATNSKGRVGIVKVHYALHNNETMSKYMESLTKHYPDIEIYSSNERTINAVLSNKDNIQVDYSTMRKYLTSIRDGLSDLVKRDKEIYQTTAMYVELNLSDKTSTETYIDFMVAPQWSEEYINKSKKITKESLESVQVELDNYNSFLLDSPLYMKHLLFTGSVFIFR